jgi:AcrR family transcriptional regulator
MPRRARPEERAETANAIKDTARALMAQHGAAGLSLRAIARALKMTAPALYYYFASLDDLITALVLDAFNGLAEAVEAVAVSHADATPYDQLVASLEAYRQWALDHSTEFMLIFGSPIPDYEAPGELTVPAAMRSQVALGVALDRVLQAGAQPPPHYTDLPAHIADHLRTIIAEQRGDYTPAIVSLTLGLWTDLQGLVLMELIDHLPPAVKFTDDWFRLEITRRLRDRGIVP